MGVRPRVKDAGEWNVRATLAGWGWAATWREPEGGPNDRAVANAMTSMCSRPSEAMGPNCIGTQRLLSC
jgi:hypothetical protein